jgi:hypothetical protein
VPWRIDAISASLNTQKFDGHVLRKGVEHPTCVATSADTSYHSIRKLPPKLLKLFFSLISDDALKLNLSEGLNKLYSAYYCRERMRTNS